MFKEFVKNFYPYVFYKIIHLFLFIVSINKNYIHTHTHTISCISTLFPVMLICSNTLMFIVD